MTTDAQHTAFGFGVATVASDGTVLDTRFYLLGLGSLADQPAPDLKAFAVADPIREITRKVVATQIELPSAPSDVSDAYLRLHLLSHRLVRPHGLSLEGIFSILQIGRAHV